LESISELLLAFKLVRVHNIEGLGVRTVGLGDSLVYFSTLDGEQCGHLGVLIKNYEGNNAWPSRGVTYDLAATKIDALPHVGADTLPIVRRYVRCFELVEHGYYSEAFVVAFSTLDDFVQQMLQALFEAKGLTTKSERNALLRSIKEDRLKLFLGPLMKLGFGKDMDAMWPGSGEAIQWLNSTRNRIAHSAARVDRPAAVKAIYACLKILLVLKENNAAKVDLDVRLFRHAKISAAWTPDPPAWVPSGELAESMDFRS
jgi:hypothetical protein